MLAQLRAKRGGTRPVARVRRERHFEVSCLDHLPGTPVHAATATDFARAHHATLGPLLNAATQSGLLVFAPTRIARFRRFLAGSIDRESSVEPTGTYAKWAAAGVDPERWNLGHQLAEHCLIPLTAAQLADWPLCWWAASPDSGAGLLLELPAQWLTQGPYLAGTFDPGCTAGESSQRTRALFDHARRSTARKAHICVFYDVYLRLSFVASGPVLLQLFQVSASVCGVGQSQWPRYGASGPFPSDAS